MRASSLEGPRICRAVASSDPSARGALLDGGLAAGAVAPVVVDALPLHQGALGELGHGDLLEADHRRPDGVVEFGGELAAEALAAGGGADDRADGGAVAVGVEAAHHRDGGGEGGVALAEEQ